jgi:recombination protein RecR
MDQHLDPMAVLIEEFQKMPTIGPKSAQRLAFYILSLENSEAQKIIQAIKTVKEKMRYCSQCFNITVSDPCEICVSPKRDKSILCVVSDLKDLISVEKTREYHGLYHILGGVISPLDGMTPETLRIKELLHRIKDGQFKEIIMAINPTVEGEATMIYLGRLLSPLGIKMTRIAYGIPIGGNIDYADEMTLAKSFEGRAKL